MENHFSIGQMSKLHNISVQTLRHYDKMDLLKPSYTNSSTGYRYYSTRDFLTMDLIKQCKSMGLALDEIKEVIKNYTSLESILDTLSNQRRLVDDKIKELESIKYKINSLEDKIRLSLKNGINEVFIKHNEERKFLKYQYTSRYTDEFELNLRELLLEIERTYGDSNAEIVFTTSYYDINNINKNANNIHEVTYNNVMIHLEEEIDYEENKVIVLPKGDYITLYFDDQYINAYKYYKKVIDYIKNNNIKVQGDFYEIYIMTRVGNDGREKSLGQIEIKI
ncbi:MerR family transcriptional regulator [Romboutsia sedimentorum]|uniref:MerR family transcriptional regulator n=1 Tax=Romboutsia sedimentorum TaxID=1368474 RepID=A0ABT7E6D3_9FIRM|nr:MerR family transcriptional regulator [Romboutsia sedimentorum]MDK2562472.1 MerR family transcriptional regulator [Romboutsia sedimentorum]